MTKETKDLGAAPPRSLCEVCGREKYTVEPVRSIEELRRVCWRQSAIQEDRDCFRLAYERAASDLRSARKLLGRLIEVDASFKAQEKITPIPFIEWERRHEELDEVACAARVLLGTAPEAPPDSSAALLEARRLLHEAREFADPLRPLGAARYEALRRDLDAFLRSDSERSEPARSESGGSKVVHDPSEEGR